MIFNINKIYERYAYVIDQNQKSFSYFMDRTKHNMNFSKANDRNNTNAINKFTTLNLKVNICVLTYCKYRSIIQYWKRVKLKYLWDIRILCATEQNQKSKCEHTQHKLFKSKWPKQFKCNQQIYYTQSQGQYIHAYSHAANTNQSYSIENVEK